MHLSIKYILCLTHCTFLQVHKKTSRNKEAASNCGGNYGRGILQYFSRFFHIFCCQTVFSKQINDYPATKFEIGRGNAQVCISRI